MSNNRPRFESNLQQIFWTNDKQESLWNRYQKFKFCNIYFFKKIVVSEKI